MNDDSTSEPHIGWRRRLRNFADDWLPQGRWWRIAGVALLAYLIVVLIVGMYWSIAPSRFDVVDNARRYLPAESGEPMTGAVTTAALLGVVDTLLSKPGGFLRNDRFPPGVYLDNMPNWEYGALVQSRDMSRALRESFSRSQSQSTEDELSLFLIFLISIPRFILFLPVLLPLILLFFISFLLFTLHPFLHFLHLLFLLFLFFLSFVRQNNLSYFFSSSFNTFTLFLLPLPPLYSSLLLFLPSQEENKKTIC